MPHIISIIHMLLNLSDVYMVLVVMAVSDERHLIYKFVLIPHICIFPRSIFLMQLEGLEVESIMCVAVSHVLQLLVIGECEYSLRLLGVSKVSHYYLTTVRSHSCVEHQRVAHYHFLPQFGLQHWFEVGFQLVLLEVVDVIIFLNIQSLHSFRFKCHSQHFNFLIKIHHPINII